MLIDGSMIMSGFVSKVINEIVDIPGNPIKNAIKKADKDRKAKNQNIETRVYQVIIDAMKEFTIGTYKSEDILYDATEMIINGFRSKKENIEAVKTGLKILESQISDDRCADFLRILCNEICKDENDILYREIVLMQQQQTLREMHKGFEENTRNQGTALEILEDVREDTKCIREKLDNNVEHCSELQIQNRAEEYAAKWDKNVFLNDFNKRDKNAGVNIKLRDLYLDKQLPHYIWTTGDEPLSDLKELLREYTVDNDGKKMLLILGQPGIGKSTLITWMMANFGEKKDDFLVYQFASDLKNIDWQGENILGCIIQTLKMKYGELESKVLIIDGFDEIHANSDRERILNKLNQELEEINILKNFSLIITCRENYVSELRKIECSYIVLQAWDSNQIKRFCKEYGKESGSDISEIKINKLLDYGNVFGIPLILYMVLALDITIEKSESLVDVYDQIFSIDRSSIYDRCIKNSRYGGEHRISEDKIRQAIHQISQRIAFWIFENNSEKAFIPQKEYEDICDSVIKENLNGNDDIKRDFLIGNYFKLINHCDGVGTQELYFNHRSIYEYFVVVYFYELLHNLTTLEELAGRLGELLKDGHLSQQILKIIKYKFDKIRQYSLSDITRETFQLMLRDGMTYHMKEKCKNVITCELNIFANMLEVVHLWSSELGKLDNIVCYLQYNRRKHLNLRNTDLSRTDLSGVDLSEADLDEADLSEADLSGTNLSEANLGEANLGEANLRRANLREANLSETYLSKADLSRTNLSEADLRGANLSEADLGEADLRGADLRGANLSEADLRGANLNEINLRGADLRGADLRGADLIGQDLISVNLIGANLRGANLRGANLSEANLSEADLNEADLIGVDLIGTDLIRANLIRANLRGANLRGADLSEADLSETIFDEDLFEMLYEKYDLSKSNIFVFNISDVVSYNDYVLENNSKKG